MSNPSRRIDHTAGAQKFWSKLHLWAVFVPTMPSLSYFPNKKLALEYARGLWCGYGGEEAVEVAKVKGVYRSRL